MALVTNLWLPTHRPAAGKQGHGKGPAKAAGLEALGREEAAEKPRVGGCNVSMER